MRTLLTLSLLLYGSLSWAQLSLDEIRRELVFEEFNKEQTVSFYKRMSVLEEQDPVVLAYKGVSEALMAKVKWDPFSKLAHLADARDMIDEAIEMDRNNLEIRFLRFSLEYYVPSIFRISKNMEEDKEVIIANLRNLDGFYFEDDMVQFILNFLDESELCTNEEVAFIQANLTAPRT